MDPVVHFEFPADDTKRIGDFYARVFGWRIQKGAPSMWGYVHAATTPPGAHGRPKMAGAINGGFYPKKPDFPAQYPSVVIAVKNIKAAMAKVAAAGGRVLGNPVEIPGAGPYVSFLDTEGNRVSMMQPRMKATPRKKPKAKKKAKARAKK